MAKAESNRLPVTAMQIGAMVGLRSLFGLEPLNYAAPGSNKPVQHSLTPLRAKYHNCAPASPVPQTRCYKM